jgi:hypothetical protein
VKASDDSDEEFKKYLHTIDKMCFDDDAPCRSCLIFEEDCGACFCINFCEDYDHDHPDENTHPDGEEWDHIDIIIDVCEEQYSKVDFKGKAKKQNCKDACKPVIPALYEEKDFQIFGHQVAKPGTFVTTSLGLVAVAAVAAVTLLVRVKGRSSAPEQRGTEVDLDDDGLLPSEELEER